MKHGLVMCGQIGDESSGGRKGGGGLKLHSDMKETHAKGHKQAPKAARKAM